MTKITITTALGEVITLERDEFVEVCEYVGLDQDARQRLALMLEFLAAMKSEVPND